MDADELVFHLRLAVFEQHGNDFGKIAVQLIQRSALRMCARKTWDITHEEAPSEDGVR